MSEIALQTPERMGGPAAWEALNNDVAYYAMHARAYFIDTERQKILL
jgi:hypothetical protein